MVRKEERKERNKEMKEGRVKGRKEERSWTPKFSKLYFLWSKYGPTHCINTVYSILASSLASFHCWLVEKLMVSNNMSPELLSSLLPVDIIAFFKKNKQPSMYDFTLYSILDSAHQFYSLSRSFRLEQLPVHLTIR